MSRRIASVKNKYFCLKCYDQNYLIECKCGCGKLLFRYSKHHVLREFLKNHNSKFRDNSKYLKYDKHHNWKGGRYKRKDGYWELFLPDYFSSSKAGRVKEHVYFYQEYNKCCILPWGVVHHIEPVTETYCNNMPWNLEGMMRRNHISLHHKGKKRKKKDHSNTKCSNPNCKDPTTTRFRKDRGGFYEWYRDGNNGWLCARCYERRLDNRRKTTLQKRLS
jgi:hypothetical protein